MRERVRTEVHVHQDSEKKTSVVLEERKSLKIKDGFELAGWKATGSAT